MLITTGKLYFGNMAFRIKQTNCNKISLIYYVIKIFWNKGGIQFAINKIIW